MVRIFFYNHCFYKENWARRVRKIEVHKDITTKFELGVTAADIQRRKERRQEKGMKRHKNRGGQEGGNYTLSRGVSGRKACKERQK